MIDAGDAGAAVELELELRSAHTGAPVTVCFEQPRALPVRPQAAHRPNVLLLSIDTLRGDALRHAPFLTRLGRLGRSFPNTWSSSNWTLPAHVSLFTSQPAIVHGVPPPDSAPPFLDADLRLDLPTLAEALQGRLPVIGVGGIHDVASARAMIDAGATLVQIYTAFLYSGPKLVRDLALALGAGTR